MDGNGLKASGRALWDQLSSTKNDLASTSLILNACRIVDRLDELNAEMLKAPLTVTNARGDEIANPLMSEARQQVLALRQVFASLGVGRMAEATEGPDLGALIAEAVNKAS